MTREEGSIVLKHQLCPFCGSDTAEAAVRPRQRFVVGLTGGHRCPAIATQRVAIYRHVKREREQERRVSDTAFSDRASSVAGCRCVRDPTTDCNLGERARAQGTILIFLKIASGKPKVKPCQIKMQLLVKRPRPSNWCLFAIAHHAPCILMSHC